LMYVREESGSFISYLLQRPIYS